MALVVLADDGRPFDGTSLDHGPLGGAETAFIGLAEGFAARGHAVTAYTRGGGRLTWRGVAWRDLAEGTPDGADLYVANRGHRVLDLVRRADRTFFWIHNPARYLLKWRYLHRLARRRPAMVFLGPHHRGTYPAWAPGGRRLVLPLALSEPFLAPSTERPPPPPRLIFTSSPKRGLGRLLELWTEKIRPAVPGAELHLYSSLATYGAGDTMLEALFARAAAEPGVVVNAPVAKPALAEALRQARAMAYAGDEGETFCLAVAEAQSVGLPAVVGRLGAVQERVIDGETGFVVADEHEFVARTVALLTDDGLWRKQHRAALQRQRGADWASVAARFEAVNE